MEKTEYVDGLLKQYFYLKDLLDKLIVEIDDTWHQYTGVHSPSMSSVHATPEDKGHKILRIGEDKIKPLENQRDKVKFESDVLYQKMRLYELDYTDYTLLEMYYRYGIKQELIANKLGYADKTVVCRKQRKLINEICKNV